MNDNFGGQAEYNAIDFVKFIMALVVVAIHTEPFHGSSENIQVLFDTFSGLAVPFFFISFGFLLGKRVQENNNLLPVKKQLVKILKMYIKWSVIYLPLAIYDYWSQNVTPLKATVLYFRNLFLGGMHYNSWQLWYLLSTVYGLIFLLLLLNVIKSIQLKYICVTVVAIFSLLLSYIVSLKSCPDIPCFVLVVGSIIQKTILNGRILQGLYYIPIGFFLSRSKEKNNKFMVITLFMLTLFLRYIFLGNKFLADFFLIAASISLFEIVIRIKLDDSKVYSIMRSISTITYLIHMWVWTIFYCLIYKEKTYGIECWVFTSAFSMIISVLYYLTKSRSRKGRSKI